MLSRRMTTIIRVYVSVQPIGAWSHPPVAGHSQTDVLTDDVRIESLSLRSQIVRYCSSILSRLRESKVESTIFGL
jgi:hypothetical protein